MSRRKEKTDTRSEADVIEVGRKLTEAEFRRKEQFEAQREKLLREGYREKNLTIGVVYANVMAFILGLPPAVILGALFFWRNQSGAGTVTAETALLLLILLLVLAVVHELIHGVTWAIFAEGHVKAIEFGFIARYLTPYCCCKSPLGKYVYALGAFMPTLLLGILPAVIAIWNGSWLLLLVGILMIFCGGGDLTIILKMFTYRSDSREQLYLDHPYECGLVLFER